MLDTCLIVDVVRKLGACALPLLQSQGVGSLAILGAETRCKSKTDRMLIKQGDAQRTMSFLIECRQSDSNDDLDQAIHGFIIR